MIIRNIGVRFIVCCGMIIVVLNSAAGLSLPKYTIDCRFEPAGKDYVLKGTAVISAKNSSEQPLTQLTVDSSGCKVEGLEVKIGDKSVYASTNAASSKKTRRLVVDLASPVGAGKEMVVQVQFSRGSIMQCPIITDWYPRLALDSTHANFDVKLEPPEGCKMGTSGRPDPKTGRYYADKVRSFGLYVTGDLLLAETNAEDVVIRCFYTSKGEQCARLLMASAVDVINFYRQQFGFYPYPSLVIVPGADRPMGGWPIATGIVGVHGFEQFTQEPETHWRWITAHEVGHQYWGEYVISGKEIGWLCIGMGLYADREYAKARGMGMAKHKGCMDRYFEGVRGLLDTTVEWKTPPAFDFNNVVVHGKGYSIISALACLLGKDTFDRIYKRCLKEYAGRDLATAEFQKVCEEESKQELGWFFDQWLRSNKYLSYEIASRDCRPEGDRYVSRIGVKCLGTLKMPVPVKATFEDGTAQLKFTDRLSDNPVVEFQSKARLKEVQLDPGHELALVVPPPKELPKIQMTDSANVASGVLHCTVNPEGKPDIFISDPEQKVRMNITRGRLEQEGWGQPWGPVGSPDGKSVVLYQGQRSSNKTKIWLIDMDGLKLREVGVYQEAWGRFTWAPDSASFAFTAMEGKEQKLYIVDRQTLVCKAIAAWTDKNNRSFDLSWSPDGKLIRTAKTPGTSNTVNVSLVSTDGKEEKKVIELNAAKTQSGGCWSPDSRQLVMVVDGRLSLVSLDGKVLKQFGEANDVDDWSADGKYISYTTRGASMESGSQMILSVADGTARKVEVDGRCAGGLFSPDSRCLATWHTTGLLVVEPAGKNPRQFGNSYRGSTMAPCWIKIK